MHFFQYFQESCTNLIVIVLNYVDFLSVEIFLISILAKNDEFCLVLLKKIFKISLIVF